MAGEFWVNASGQNLLGGIDPPVLEDDDILDFLRRIPDARASFERLYPTMTVEERTRLRALTEGLPLWIDPHTREDNFQNRQNTEGIFTTGPRGGTRRGGNH